MEKAGPREAYGSAGDPSGPDSGSRPDSGVRVPPQARAADVDRDRGASRAGDPRNGTGPAAPAAPAEPAARGEHTHSETPIPQPRAAREVARGAGAATGDGLPGAAGADLRGVSAGLPGVEARGFSTNVPGTGTRGAPPGAPGAPAGRRTSAPGGLGAPGSPGVSGERGVPAARTPSVSPRPPLPPRPVIQRSSVRGQILDALRAALVGGELAPGEVYSAPALGERFGVSATPVREAMQQLAVEGAVEVVPNRGFRVVRRGTRELAELAEIRALIEVPVLLRLARTVSASCWAEVRPLAEATTAAASTGDPARYAESDRAFHAGLLALSGNRQLVQLTDDLHRRAQWPLAGTHACRTRAELLADAAEHKALLDALIAQDLPTVQCLVREHFAGGF